MGRFMRVLALGVVFPAGSAVAGETDGSCRTSRSASMERAVAPACCSKTWRARAPIASSVFTICKQLDQHLRQLFSRRDADGVVRAQVLGDGAEVGVMRAHHDGHAELRRLERIVSAGWNEASADEGHGRQRIDRRQLADGVEQHDLPGAQQLESRLPASLSNPSVEPMTHPTLREARPRRRIAPDGAAQAP